MRWTSAILALATLSLLGARGAQAANDEFRAVLRGAQEVPPVSTRTVGEAKINFNGAPSTVLVEIDLGRGQRVTQAHFHCARRGVNGPIVAFLAGFHDRGWDVDGLSIDHETLTNANILQDATPAPPACPRAINNLADLRRAMIDGLIYVNVHSVAIPSGVVRGQVVRVD